MSDQRDEHVYEMATPALLKVGSLQELPPGAVTHVVAGDTELALVNLDGHPVAIRDLCLRCGSALSSGALASGQLTCGKCGWRYDVMRGCVVDLPALRFDRHELRVADGNLFVAVAADDPPPPTT